MTGCKNRAAEPAGSCGSEFESARALLVPARASDGTAGCLRAFGQAFNGGFTATAAHIRAALYFCLGANGLFSGVGYGFDGEDFTSAEYLINNVRLKEDLNAEVFELYRPKAV